METTQLIWIIAVTLLSLVNIVWQLDLQTRLRRLEERYRRLSGGAEAGRLDTGAILEQVDAVRGRVEKLEDLARQAQAVLGHTVQGVGIVRFRALTDVGGDQSFALALVDGGGNGVVLSALYLREGTRFYAKPLTAWNSTYPLTDEEKQALEQARQTIRVSS